MMGKVFFIFKMIYRMLNWFNVNVCSLLTAFKKKKRKFLFFYGFSRVLAICLNLLESRGISKTSEFQSNIIENSILCSFHSFVIFRIPFFIYFFSVFPLENLHEICRPSKVFHPNIVLFCSACNVTIFIMRILHRIIKSIILIIYPT